LEKKTGIAWADAILCAMNLTESNRGYFSYSLLKKIKTGNSFYQYRTGEHSPTADLIKTCRGTSSGRIGLDVYENEPDVASDCAAA